MAAFTQGLETGARLAKGWLETYDTTEEKLRKKRAAEEIAAAGSTGLAEVPAEPRMYMPGAQAAPAQAGLGTGMYGTEDDFTGLTPPPSAQPPVSPPGTGYGRRLQPDQADAIRSGYAAGGMAGAERAATQQGVPTQGLSRELPMSQQLRRQADIYTKYGLTDQAEQYRLKAYDVSRQEELDARSRSEFDLRQNTNKAARWIAEQQQAGRPLDMTLISQAQTQFGGDYSTLLSTATSVLGITDKIAEAETKKLTKSISQAALKGPEAFNSLLASFADPNKEDNIIPTYTKVKGGFQVMYGDRPLSPVFADAEGVTALQQAASYYTNMAMDKPFETAVQLASLKRNAAQTKQAEATAAHHLASADLARANIGLVQERAAKAREGDKNAEERATLMGQWDDLTPEEQAGAKGQAILKKFNMLNVKAGGTVPLGTAPKAGKATMELTPGQTALFKTLESSDAYKTAIERGDLVKARSMLANIGIPPEAVLGAQAQPPGAGWGGQAAPAKKGLTAAPAARTTPALSPDNVRLLSAAGNEGFNVQLPDGSTRIMSPDELERIGFRFPGGTGLQRPWYADLLPQR